MLIKDGDQVREMRTFYINENGEKVWNVPSSPDELREALKDTVRWVVGIRLQRELGNIAADTASVMKAVVLVVKVLAGANLKSVQTAISTLTEKEQTIWNGLLELTNAGYADSDTLQMKLQKLQELLQWKNQIIQRLEAAETVEDLIEIGEEIRL